MRKKYILNFIGIIIIILIWVIFSLAIKNDLVVPKISSVIIKMVQIFSKDKIYIIILTSVLKIVLIMSMSLLLSISLSLLSYKCLSFQYIIEPFINLIKTMPIVTIIILIFMLFRMKYASVIATLLVSIPIMYEGILNALKSIDKDMLDDLSTCTNPKSLYSVVHVHIPIIFSYIKTSITQSFGLGFKVMLMAEYISPMNNTLGAEMRRYYNNNEMEAVYCIVIISLAIVSLISLITNQIIKKEKNS